MGRQLKRLALSLLLLCPMAVQAQNSRILATGGGTSLEGQAGGGITPWAVMAGYGSSGEWSATAYVTHVSVDDYELDAYGVAASFNDRLELSLAHHQLDLGTLGPLVGRPGGSLEQDVIGLKYRLGGDLIYTQTPQIVIGLQYKAHDDLSLPRAVGALRDSDVEAYLSVARLWLAGLFDRNVFANGTIRLSRANQLGLLGFGGDRGDSHELLLEAAAGLFLNREVAVGFEYRMQPDNLAAAPQDDWYSAFVGWFPNKRLSLIAAWADLGDVATLADQSGFYLSLELTY